MSLARSDAASSIILTWMKNICYATLSKLYVLRIFRRAIIQNDDLRPEAPLSNLLYNDFWGTPLSHSGSHKSYRPLSSLTLKINYAMSGGGGGVHSAFSYHLANVALHALATYLVVVYSRHVFPSRRSSGMVSALLSGMLFALHPVHTEAVAGIVGRAELLSAVFFFSSLIAFHAHMRERCDAARKRNKCASFGGRGSDANGNVVKSAVKGSTERRESKYLALTVLFAACAMFSKEQGITVLGVCMGSDLIFGSGASPAIRKRSLGILASCAVGLVSLRFGAMGFSPPHFAKADNPASAHDSLIARGLTFLHLPVLNAWLLLCPANLSFDWSMDAVPLVEAVADPRNLLTLVFYASLAYVAITRAIPVVLGQRQSRSDRFVAVCALLLVLPFLPATNLLFYVGFVVAERVLYIPSAGFCLLAGHGVTRLLAANRGKMLRVAAAVCLAVLLAASWLRTVARNHDWTDEERLYRSGITINPPKGECLFEGARGRKEKGLGGKKEATVEGIELSKIKQSKKTLGHVPGLFFRLIHARRSGPREASVTSWKRDHPVKEEMSACYGKEWQEREGTSGREAGGRGGDGSFVVWLLLCSSDVSGDRIGKCTSKGLSLRTMVSPICTNM